MSDIHQFDSSASEIKGFLEHVRKNRPHSVFCIGKNTNIRVLPPTQRRKTYKFKFDVEIPAEIIVGEEELRDFGGFGILNIAKKRIDPDYLRES